MSFPGQSNLVNLEACSRLFAEGDRCLLSNRNFCGLHSPQFSVRAGAAMSLRDQGADHACMVAYLLAQPRAPRRAKYSESHAHRKLPASLQSLVTSLMCSHLLICGL